MAHAIPVMGDSRRKVTDEEILRLLKTGKRPVWTTSKLAEELDITRQTANDRLKQLEKESEDVVSIDVGRATAYYVPGIPSDPPGDTTEEQHRKSIIQWATDRFVGLPSDPSTAVHPNDGPAEGGDKIQIWVEGVPGNWADKFRFAWDNRREQLHPEELIKSETQALISGELYEKPTVPIEHSQYPDDYDLEGNIGGRYEEVSRSSRPVLIAAGLKNYLIKPCNNAVFLKNVSVDWISPQGDGAELDENMTFDASGEEIEAEIIEEATERAKEFLDEYEGGGEPGL